MNIIKLLISSFLFVSLTTGLCVVSPAGKTQLLVPPGQVSQGLAKSDWSSIREAYEAGRHACQPVEGGWQASNPGQQWTTKFDGRGFVSEPKGGGWQWGLELKRYGFPGAERVISDKPAVRAFGQRVTYVWDAVLSEWFVNDTRGLEHGFTVKERPVLLATRSLQSVPLNFTLAVRGSLVGRVTMDGQGVLFCDNSGATVVNYSGLKVWDADGKILPSWFAPLDPQQPSLVTLQVDERNARYPLTIDPIAQQAYLKASNTGASDQFGVSVAVSGDTVVVGAWAEDSNATGMNGNQADNSAANSGAAYVFTRTGTAWTQQAYLKASNTESNDLFGQSVAVSGDTVVVGARSEDSNVTGVNGNQADNSGTNSGAAYIFTRSGTTWSQQAYLKASNTGVGDNFGSTVAMSGDTVVVGARLEDSNATSVNGNQADNSGTNSGAAYVFTRSGTTWTQQAYLKASNTGADDNFGWAVAASGDTVVVGAYTEDSNATGVNGNPADNSGTNSGAAYVFTRAGTTWTQQAYLKASNTGIDDQFGYSVSVSGDTLVVGAYREDSDSTGVNGNQADGIFVDTGAAYVFSRAGTVWTQQAYLKASNTGPLDNFGYSVAVSGDIVVVGANSESSNATGVNGNQANNSFSGSGAAYAFTRSGTTWTQQAYLKASNTEAGDVFGQSVAVSGDTVVVGAFAEDSNATGVNGNQADNSVTTSGAAYIFTGVGNVQTPVINLQNLAVLGNGAFQFAFTNLSGLSFTVLTSTNVALPLNLWSNLGLAVETPANSGQFQFTDAQAANHPTRFYRVRSP